MIFIIILNTILLLTIILALGKMIGASEDRQSNVYEAGYKKGRQEALQMVQQNMERHREILPEWILAWIEHMNQKTTVDSNNNDILNNI